MSNPFRSVPDYKSEDQASPASVNDDNRSGSDQQAETHVIVIGNEKGGSGKTTAAMHLIVSLMKAGYEVGALDLDIRQKSLSRYLENRVKWAIQNDVEQAALPVPLILPPPFSKLDSREQAYAAETRGFQEILMKFSRCDFLVIDCPGADTHLSRLAHAHADTIVTPMNDSFVDFDLLARIDSQTGEIEGPSLYAEMVWEARQTRARAGIMGGIDWVVMRNRMGAVNANNKKRVGKMLDQLSKRIGFRLSKGFGERVIYRELFPMGLTLLDLGADGVPRSMTSMSHVTARFEIRTFLASLNLPDKRGLKKVA